VWAAGEVSGAGFVAGTLVHAKDGLTPIENLKVGDLVLSRQEGEGDFSYKRVTKTFELQGKEIWLIGYVRADGSTWEHLTVTGTHPFWVVGAGWTSANRAACDDALLLAAGQQVTVMCSTHLYRTDEDRYGWSKDAYGPHTADHSGFRVCLADQKVEVLFDHDADDGGRVSNDKYFYLLGNGDVHRSSVFAVEVEDNHTYFVGEFGVWVRDINP
jgi:hypothetical protein